MGRTVLRFLLVSVVFLLTGCSSKTIDGRFVSERNPLDYIELKSDGVFISSSNGQNAHGTYKISGNELTFAVDYGGGFTKEWWYKPTITGDAIISQGVIFRKQQQSTPVSQDKENKTTGVGSPELYLILTAIIGALASIVVALISRAAKKS